jgi:hypothetical protein
VASCCEHDNEPSGSMKTGHFLTGCSRRTHLHEVIYLFIWFCKLNSSSQSVVKMVTSSNLSCNPIILCGRLFAKLLLLLMYFFMFVTYLVFSE